MALSITVAGGGSWGTALANLLAQKGQTHLWLRNESLARQITERHENPRYLPGLPLHPDLFATADPSVLSADVLVLAIPCQYVRSWLKEYKEALRKAPILCNAAKGIEIESRETVSSIVAKELADITPRYAVLSGPSFARETILGLPTAVVLASHDETIRLHLQNLFATQTFRCYSSDDVTGVEIGGALKNIMAIAAGILDGLELGMNSRAALITRGLTEMKRMGIALGAREATFMGLSGLGDLTLTATGSLSRNHTVGVALGQGRSLKSIQEELGMVAEGVATTKAAHTLAMELGVEAPLTNAVFDILYNGVRPKDVLHTLFARKLRPEDD
ncbi:MAG: NAD(P)-dependent glycerol-3-phosphate dehydrogenase [Desulfovibrio sp.]|nr:NAD(P)-dependent glycerol-3-phosphate dehydrogenase [Desulfovibrio sp.]